MRKSALPPEIRDELRALRAIVRWLDKVSPAGRRWLADALTADLNKKAR